MNKEINIREINILLDSIKKQNSYILDLTDEKLAIKKSYKELAQEVEKNTSIWRGLGIEAGMTVVLALPSNISLLIQILSLMSIGASVVPVSNLLEKEVFKYICKNVKPAALYVTSKFEDEYLEEHIIYKNNLLYGNCSLAITSKDKFINEELKDTLLLTTSGSTGFPKSVVHKTNNLLLNGKLHIKSIKAEGKGTYLSSLSFFFSYGLVAGIFGSLISGKNIIIPERPIYPKLWFEYCNKYDVTLSSMTPGVLRKLLNIKEKIPSSLKTITIGGEKADLIDIEALKKRFQGNICLTYGLSEAGPRVFTNIVSDNKEEWKYMGEPIDRVEVSLNNPQRDGESEIGELIVSSPTNMIGYLYEGEVKRDNDFIGQWLLTGDICKTTADKKNYIYVERIKNTIKCSGENLYPALIRKVIINHPLVQEAKIEGIEDREFGYVPICSIKFNEKCSATSLELRKWCKKHLKLIEIPREFRVVENIEFFTKI